MLDKETVVFWNAVEHELYEENGHKFCVELDLFNNHKYYYHKEIKDDVESCRFLSTDISKAIDKFNAMLQNKF